MPYTRLAILTFSQNRLVNPHEVYVDLSDKLYHIKSDLLEEMSMKALGEQ